MKIKKTVPIIAACIAGFTLTRSVRADDLFLTAAQATALVHRPIAASPHALEEFSWLLRPKTIDGNSAARENSLLASIRKNKAFSKTPRALEEYTGLRSNDLSNVTDPRATLAFDVPADVLENEAWARSPRVMEIYPSLANYDWRKVKPIRAVNSPITAGYNTRLKARGEIVIQNAGSGK